MDDATTIDDWRTTLQPDSRQRIVNKITEFLKTHLPVSTPEGLVELSKVAARFEEEIYTAGTSQSDYLRKISMKMLTMETKSQTTGMANSIQSNSVGSAQNPPDPASHSMQSQVRNQGQSQISLPNQSQAQPQLLSQNVQNTIANTGIQSSASSPSVTSLTQTSMPNAAGQSTNVQSGIAQNSVGNSVSQVVRSNIFSNTQRQMQGRQQSQQIAPQQQQRPSQNPQFLFQQQQQLQHQLMKQKLRGNIQSSLLPSHMQQQPQQQQPNLLQPAQMPSSQHMQMSSSLQSSQPTLQQSQPSVMQSATHSGLQQNQPSTAAQSTASASHNMQSQFRNQWQCLVPLPNQPQARQQLLSQNVQNSIVDSGVQSLTNLPSALASVTSLTQTSMPNAAGQSTNMRSGIKQNSVDSLVSLALPSNTFSNSSSRDSMAHTGQNAVDWQEELYQKIQSMKEKYLSDLNDMSQKISIKCQQLEHDSVLNVPKSEQIDRLKMFNNMLERNIQFLNMPKNNIVPAVKNKLSAYEKQIIGILRSRKPVSSQQEIQQPGDHPLSMQPQQQQQQQPDNQMQPTAVSSMHHGVMPPLSNHMDDTSTGTLQSISNDMIKLQDLDQHRKQQLEQQFQQCQLSQQFINQHMQPLLQQQLQLLQQRQQLLQQPQQVSQLQQYPQQQQQLIQQQQQISQLQEQFDKLSLLLLQRQSTQMQAANKMLQLQQLNGGAYNFPTTTTPQLRQVTSPLEISQQHSFSASPLCMQQQCLLPIYLRKTTTPPLQSTSNSPSNMLSAASLSTPLLEKDPEKQKQSLVTTATPRAEFRAPVATQDQIYFLLALSFVCLFYFIVLIV